MFKVDDKIGSKYRFVILCAQRTRQLLEGAEPRVETVCKKPAHVAMREVQAGQVTWTQSESQVPLPPEAGEVLQVEVGP
ncbi:MAG: DNA-directed RNA polymerase subunit omega [Acidobacteriota bacterium]